MSVEPVDPKPRQGQGPRPLRAADPVDPNAALEAPLTVLRGVGPETAKDFERLGLSTLGDLLHYYPRRYDNYARMKTINRLQYGEECTLIATVSDMRERKFKGNRTMLQVTLTDGTGTVEVTEFNPYRKQLLTPGRQVVVSGKVDQYLGRLTIKPREWEKLDVELLNTGRIVPVYGLTEGLYQRGLRNLTAQVANFWARRQNDPLPAEIVSRAALMNYGEALAQIHFPDNETKLADAQHRLAFDELFALQIGVLRQRRDWQTTPAQPLTIPDAGLEAFLSSLPYPLTGAQKRVVGEIRADLAASTPMNRLLQGDVGSGKTVVALLAAAAVNEVGKQAALMAPTEILARQHFERIEPLAREAGMKVALLTGRDKAAERRATLEGLDAGDIDIVVGTHALVQDNVAFRDLALAIVDEQHRFGVHQRLALGEKGEAVDVLVMTATPIPRTLVLTYFGDMDVSNLREKPAGRQKIDTRAAPLERIDDVVAGLQRAIASGARAYWVCPLVAENEELDVAAAQDRFEDLQKHFGARVGLVHGQMKGKEKDAAMLAFQRGETQVLVATTVIEVGVDVPEATIIVIEHAERFGLAQLHQLRGRVGRGAQQSSCILLYKGPLGETAKARISILRESDDGFRLAEEDLKLRGEGEILGTRQSGLPGFRLADLSVHGVLLKLAREDVDAVLETDEALTSERGRALRLLLYLFERDEAVKLLRAG